MRLNVRLLVSVLLLLALTTTQAMIDLELTQGVAASVPIAVIPFSGPKVMVAGNETLQSLIDNDLQNSGEFRVINQDQKANLAADETLSNEQWRQRGADYVVSGAVNKHVGDRYSVSLQLRSVFDGHDKTQKSGVLLSETFNSSSAGLRALGHRISDDIFQKLTGVRGVFSTKIAYILVQHLAHNKSHYQLEVADADGFNPQTLLSSNEPIMSPSWSPDARHLAYVSFEGHHAAIYEQNLASGQRRLISATPGINGAPAYSPDGKKLALVLTRTGNPKIYVYDFESKRLQAITHGWSIDTEPAFSADASTLLFTSNRDGSPQIYQYSFPTGSISRVTYSGNYNARATLTPDGKSIVMMHRETGEFGIARFDIASEQLQTLVQTGADESPSLAPNGRMIIYATQYAGRGVLAQVSLDGRIKLRLPAREGSVQEPAWSPFLNNQ